MDDAAFATGGADAPGVSGADEAGGADFAGGDTSTVSEHPKATRGGNRKHNENPRMTDSEGKRYSVA